MATCNCVGNEPCHCAKPRTVRVRLLVAVWDDNGDWLACGTSAESAAENSQRLREMVKEDSRHYREVWVESDLPMAEPAVVAGHVAGEG